MISRCKRFLYGRLLFRRNASVSAARHIDPIPEFTTEESASLHLYSLCKRKLYNEALAAFRSLQSHDPDLRLYLGTYRQLLLACSHLDSPASCLQVHRHLSRFVPAPDVIMCNHLIHAYGRCGSLDEARKLFDEMLERNVVSWMSMITAYAKNGRPEEALDLYLEMLQSGFFPDKFALAVIVGACSRLGNPELGKQLHCHVVKSEFGSDKVVQTALLSLYARLGRVDDAEVVFARIKEKNLVSWGAMTSGFAQHGREMEALRCFRQMLRIGGYYPNGIVFGSVFRACSGLSQLHYGEQMHGVCLKLGLELDASAGCSLSAMYSKFGSLDSAMKALYQIETPDLVAWNSIIGFVAEQGDSERLLLLFSDIRHSGLIPDGATVRHLLCGMTNSAALCQGQLVHSYIVKMGFDKNASVSNTLLTMYSKCSDYFTACHLFEDMKSSRDLVSWNSILTSCLQHDQLNDVFLFLKFMHDSQTRPDYITLSLVVRACVELACLEAAKHVHAFSSKFGLESDLMVANGLIDAYAKCGDLDYARKMFQLMGDICDVFSWSTLIVGYAQFGLGNEALELFSNMEMLGVKPNHVTFVGVLSACSRIGLVDVGLYHFKNMQHKYEITPTREHYSCVVDMLARAGQLTEAAKLVDQMPFQPDVVLWNTLLTASRVHGNVEIGEQAAGSILKLDPSNSAAYSLLSNIYAAAGFWDGVARLRKMMRNNTEKAPGKSWVEVNGKVHDFVAGDKTHPNTEVMHSMLRDLWFEMSESGYVPLADPEANVQ